jgi:hypothetical protein
MWKVCAEQRDERRDKGTRHESGRIRHRSIASKVATGREEAALGTILVIVSALLRVGAVPT